MLLTVTISTPKYICVQDNSLVIKERHEDKVLDKIPLSDIWVIIIDNPQVSITASLMGQVNDEGIGILFCGSNHMPNGLALPIGAHSRHAEIVEHSSPSRNRSETSSGQKSSAGKLRIRRVVLSYAVGINLMSKDSSDMPGMFKATTRPKWRAPLRVHTSPNYFPMERAGKAP